MKSFIQHLLSFILGAFAVFAIALCPEPPGSWKFIGSGICYRSNIEAPAPLPLATAKLRFERFHTVAISGRA